MTTFLMTLKIPFSLLILLAYAGFGSSANGQDATIEHVMVYQQKGRFGGWPANHGIWSWGNEILVGFSAGYHRDRGPALHNIDHDRPEEHLLARSKDGGRTWAIENPAKQRVLIGTAGMRHGTLPTEYTEPAPIDCPGGIDFSHSDFAMTCRMAGVHTGISRFYYSYDRGQTWKGPFNLPLFGQPGIAARTDYIINGKSDCMLFLTAAKSNKREGRPICVRTTDGGKTWKLVSLIGPEPKGYAIMPSTVRLAPEGLLTTIRRAEEGDKRKSWIEAWASSDNGRSWSLLGEPVADTGEGNPPHLLKLADGRVCLTYGNRAKPFGIFACLSSDGGKTWSEPIALRQDGGGRDLGYPRSIQRSDGKVVTVYYFWDEKTGPERYIAATIWAPGPRAK
jgi:BNR repeat-like domain